MKGFAGLILSVFILSAFFDFGSATKCYICASNKGDKKDCESHVEKEFSAECIEPTSYCMTVVVKDVLTRSCSTKSGCDAFEKNDSYCKVCNTNLCNIDSGAFVNGYSTSLIVSLGLYTLAKIFM